MQALKLLLTFTAMVTPNAIIMSAMGWTSAAHLALLWAWVLISTAVLVLISDRHRRPELPKRIAIVTLLGWVTLGAMVLGSGWNVRPVVTTLLVLPGVNYLLLEAVGLTPKAAEASLSLP